MYRTGNQNEIQEAKTAGRQALEALEEAEDFLQSARNMGIWYMLGGGLLADIMKHSRLDKATRCLEAARERLLHFQKELKDIQVPMDIKMEIGTFLTFADFFFDGIIADWMVQNKIQEAREQVEDGIIMVRTVLEDLEQMEHRINIAE